MPTFKRGDRVRDLNHDWTPDLPEFGTVTRLEVSGFPYVDWDGAGEGLIPFDPVRLALVEN